jgi:hypothetical protein
MFPKKGTVILNPISGWEMSMHSGSPTRARRAWFERSSGQGHHALDRSELSCCQVLASG